jgi:hypothetical protein
MRCAGPEVNLASYLVRAKSPKSQNDHRRTRLPVPAPRVPLGKGIRDMVEVDPSRLSMIRPGPAHRGRYVRKAGSRCATSCRPREGWGVRVRWWAELPNLRPDDEREHHQATPNRPPPRSTNRESRAGSRLSSFWTAARPGQRRLGSRSCRSPGQSHITRIPARGSKCGMTWLNAGCVDGQASRKARSRGCPYGTAAAFGATTKPRSRNSRRTTPTFSTGGNPARCLTARHATTGRPHHHPLRRNHPRSPMCGTWG